jgi:hypothetical protein
MFRIRHVVWAGLISYIATPKPGRANGYGLPRRANDAGNRKITLTLFDVMVLVSH